MYIEEIPSGVRTIVGVATSVAAFVDFFARGPMNKAVQIFNMGDFEREFGGLDTRSEASYAIQQFFLNGGTEAWVVRVASPDPPNAPTKAQVFIDDVTTVAPLTTEAAATAAATLVVTAISEGQWSNNLRVRVDSNTPTVGEFNLFISEYATVGSRTTLARQEVFRNLSMLSAQTNFVEKVVNEPNSGSKLVRVAASTVPNAPPPLVNETLSGLHPPSGPTVPASSSINVTIGGIAPPNPLTLSFPAGPPARPLTVIAPVLEAAIRAALPANPAFAGATVNVVGNGLHVLAGPTTPADVIMFTGATADALLLTTTATANSQEYPLGSLGITATAQLFGVAGMDGVPPNATAIIGNFNSKTGIHALEDAGLCARIDSARGVWKAPAGTEATLRNVTELEDVLTDPENGNLNPLAINCLRNFPIYGNICWGARTIEGADQQASEWKYLPVRRLALFLEESLYRGLKWVVFEPNDEPLWSQIRLTVGAFMQNLFRQGSFQGQTPKEAYFVKCDKETTTQNDINLGNVTTGKPLHLPVESYVPLPDNQFNAIGVF
ncbi:MAG: phage tail sheath C-terminal domain-containing protein [Candidatus Entotheonellia bacterium]